MRKQITSDVWRMLKWVLRAEQKHIMPVGGGAINQSKSFLDAWDFISGELNHWEAKRK